MLYLQTEKKAESLIAYVKEVLQSSSKLYDLGAC